VGLSKAHNRLPLLRRPSLLFVHGLEVWDDLRADWKRAASRADLLVANSAYTRERAERMHGGFARARVCWLATETDDPPARPPDPSAPPAVLIVGRIDSWSLYKGHAELIECWPQVAAAVPDARLVIVGRGPGLGELRERAARRAPDRIEFTGFVPDEELEALWARATVFAMPSRWEGFGLTYVEAMRHAVPVIASVHDAAPEINLDGQTGYNVDLEKPAELPERLVHLLRDRDHAAALGRNGYRRWMESFRFRHFRQRFAGVLGELVSTDRGLRGRETRRAAPAPGAGSPR
jgi:phosphatidylinositol alpha-1,6-mannosyltransferase